MTTHTIILSPPGVGIVASTVSVGGRSGAAAIAPSDTSAHLDGKAITMTVNATVYCALWPSRTIDDQSYRPSKSSGERLSSIIRSQILHQGNDYLGSASDLPKFKTRKDAGT